MPCARPLGSQVREIVVDVTPQSHFLMVKDGIFGARNDVSPNLFGAFHQFAEDGLGGILRAAPRGHLHDFA
ncbi:MAG TPA: hypothetical protein PLM14_16430 [Candidatus Hydrogenedentes bacterium]|nr:hypothetical protein [Candidatus Hydrogenedentota bacterium]HQH54593.1 hypothetical protein [Candidatus Hydrogenedentota bacterium]